MDELDGSGDRYRERRQRVLDALDGDAMVLPGARVLYRSRDTEYPFRADSELFYVTGVREPDAVAVISEHVAGGGFALFVRPRDEQAELWSGVRTGVEGAAERYGADVVHSVEELAERLPGMLASSDRVHFRVGVNAYVERSVLAALTRARAKGQKTGTGPWALVDPGRVLDELRLRKDPHELELLRRAADATVRAFAETLPQIAPGALEREVRARLEARFVLGGAESNAFPTIVASGPNACVLHHADLDRRIIEGDLVLVDAGASVGLYNADVTRTVPVGGFTAAQRALYDIVDAAREAAVHAVRPGATLDDVHAAAVERLVHGLVDLGILEGAVDHLISEDAHVPYFPHRTSHWLGLDVHDVGTYASGGVPRPLEPGMVLTVEPGLYLRASEAVPESLRDLGVRVEDDVLVTESGAEVLTSELPTAADEVERLCG